ncbi:SDR family NAD(P)-dependent oxidoreductase [Variovorax sp. OV329]|uniref:SDR family NAD(P)-dependent oxidoreductase n=1 Tax=Variovorax sp. OV329 TaxID=1882825 RepID=UPI0008E60537|nr:SDR family NAD(P)-dependent oxidoreductase [Variovorax sp. OV329]SFM75851.1 NAD(P)-dependent dehydrogenase, short-chain alcohol dehydrogenase family [Variovorax sp. OV329]
MSTSHTTAQHLVILTGGSRGMGRAMAEQLLARPGHTLICISRGSSAELAAAPVGEGSALQQWSHDLDDATGAAVQISQYLQGLEAGRYASATLINNAGVIARPAPLSDAQLPDLMRALRVGLEAPMLLTSAFLQATRGWTQARRKVLNISSGLGRNAMASQAAYCAAKAGMDHFSRCVALEEAQLAHGAKVVSLAPGVIDTDMQVELRSGDPAKFPDRERFTRMQAEGMLASPAVAGGRVLAYLDRADFGSQPVADVRDA